MALIEKGKLRLRMRYSINSALEV